MRIKKKEILSFYKNTSPNLNYFDIGAALPFNRFLKTYKNIFKLILFEPDKKSFEKIKKLEKKNQVYKIAISQKKNVHLNIYDSRNLSSIFKFDKRYSKILKKYKLIEKIKVKSNRLEHYIKKDYKNQGNILKIDVQGSTLDCIKSSGKKINFFSVIIVESELMQIYKNQNIFGDIETFLYKKKFLNIGSICSFHKSVYKKNIKHLNYRELNYSNSYLYVKNFFTEKLNINEYLNILLFLLEFKYYDLSEFLIKEKFIYKDLNIQKKLKKLLLEIKKNENYELKTFIKKFTKNNFRTSKFLKFFDHSREIYTSFK